MKTILCALCVLCGSAYAADKLPSKTTYAKAYGETKNAVTVDPAKDLPRYPAVPPKDAIATWQVKKGFHLELAAHEPQVRSPVAMCFDERGRMFVCEMIDYSELRDVTPHLGRISMLEDKDGDGYFETSTVFADDLPWPTGLIWANGGLYVIATPDLWFFKDSDGDGKAEVREKVFTGFGTGLKLLNVQGLANSPQWGQDNRIHILAGGGNHGVMTCLKRPELKGIELGGKDFWFDPRTLEFGLEGGGAQYGMSFDNYGRKFGCSNSDHLQYWVYDDKYANRNPYFQMPPARQSIAADGGAAEVFRISPDEPWRIIRTRWRIAGVVKGMVEGGGRVSGYFTGATGTTIYRGDAYGDEFLNNSFTGDAGGQLVHRKIIRPSDDGVSLVGERPADEHGFEFAASKDTWVRVVNFANAPDGCLHIIDMHREVIEHPWSIPDEIKKHIDLNNGSDMGRIFRLVPDKFDHRRGTKVNLADASTEELVKTLGHPNGWHRDAAQRLLYERQDKASKPMLEKLLTDSPSALGRLHALYSLDTLRGANKYGSLTHPVLMRLFADTDPFVRAHAIRLSPGLTIHGELFGEHLAAFQKLAHDPVPLVRYQLALTLSIFHVEERLYTETTIGPSGETRMTNRSPDTIAAILLDILEKDHGAPATVAAVLANRDDHAWPLLHKAASKHTLRDAGFAALFEGLLNIVGARNDAEEIGFAIDLLASQSAPPALLRSFATGLKRAGTTIDKADAKHKITAVFTKAIATAADSKASESSRLEAIELIGLASSKESSDALNLCLNAGQPDAVQSAALKTLATHSSADVTKTLLDHWPHYGAKTKTVALDAMLARDDRAIALLESKEIKPDDLSAAQVQSLVHHKTAKVAELAKTVLASVIPPSREEVVAKFKPALSTKGDATRGQNQYIARCMACHRAGTMGLQVGPDLVTVKTKGRDGILTAILEPHKEVASQFIAYLVNTKDGQTLTGIIAEDNASSLTLKMMGGITQTIQRSNIKGTSSSGQSLMPEGLETGLSVQDMADLLDFVESVK